MKKIAVASPPGCCPASIACKNRVVAEPHGFDFHTRGDEVVITHHGARATVLRGVKAARFLDDVARQDPQLLMARLTGNYRRGNERVARQHPRQSR